MLLLLRPFLGSAPPQAVTMLIPDAGAGALVESVQKHAAALSLSLSKPPFKLSVRFDH